jgi:ABC-type sugar transport system substrate-binding protein
MQKFGVDTSGIVRKAKVETSCSVLPIRPNGERLVGLLNILKKNPDAKLLDTQPANWDQAIALRTTQQLIAKYRDKIDGVWTADDAMML